MGELWEKFLHQNEAHVNWLLKENFISCEEQSGDVIPNVEIVLDRLEIACIDCERKKNALEAQKIRQKPESEAQEIGQMLEQAKEARLELFRSVVEAAKINADWWKSPMDVGLDEKLAGHRTILQKLTAARQPGQSAPWVFTTNYDLAIEWASESIELQIINGFLGVHSRRFSPHSFDLGFRNTQAKGEARFGVYNIYLAKLHGSLSWREWKNHIYEMSASEAWIELNKFCKREESCYATNSLVLPRAAKYLQTVGYIVGEMFRRFAEFMARPQTGLIFSGYGFRDEHINRLVRSALLNPTLQVVIYLPELTSNCQSQNLPETVRRLLDLKNPRLTLVGGGERAYIDALASDLPDPTIFDQDLEEIKRLLESPKGSCFKDPR